MLTKLAKRRLTKLVEFMEHLPKSAEKHFDMDRWFRHNADHEHLFGDYVDAKALQYCGTTACALGWACTIPAFRRAGLKMSVGYQRHSEMLSMGEAFFELTEEQMRGLFGFGQKGLSTGMAKARSPKQWAKLARKLISQWETAR